MTIAVLMPNALELNIKLNVAVALDIQEIRLLNVQRLQGVNRTVSVTPMKLVSRANVHLHVHVVYLPIVRLKIIVPNADVHPDILETVKMVVAHQQILANQIHVEQMLCVNWTVKIRSVTVLKGIREIHSKIAVSIF